MHIDKLAGKIKAILQYYLDKVGAKDFNSNNNNNVSLNPTEQ
jgi:hypothetical protein